MLDLISIMSRPSQFTLHKQQRTKLKYFNPLDGENSSSENENLLDSNAVNMTIRHYIVN